MSTNLKIAILHGRNLEGSGIERHAAEWQYYCSNNNIETKIFFYQTEPRKIRYSHVDVENAVFFNVTENSKYNIINIADAFEQLNTYDIVILNNTPTSKDPSHQLEFLKKFQELSNPITVFNQFDARPKLADKMPFHLLYENMCDQLCLLSSKTEYSENIQRVFPNKPINIQRHIINIPDNVKDNWKDVSSKNTDITFMGRWHTIRDVERLLDFYDTLKSHNSKLSVKLYGIETMIGALSTVDHKNSKYFNKPYGTKDNTVRKNRTNKDGVPGDCEVYPAYSPEQAIEIMSNSMFCYSGFNLKKDKQNYRDMFEYAQIEFLLSGTVAAFDKHFCDNNFDENGIAFSDKNISICWDKDNPEQAYSDFEKIMNNPELYEEMRENALKHVIQEHSSSKFVPIIIESILKNGKQTKTSNDDLLFKIYGTKANVDLFWEKAKDNVMELGFKNYDNGTMRIIDGRKIQNVELIPDIETLDGEW